MSNWTFIFLLTLFIVMSGLVGLAIVMPKNQVFLPGINVMLERMGGLK